MVHNKVSDQSVLLASTDDLNVVAGPSEPGRRSDRTRSPDCRATSRSRISRPRDSNAGVVAACASSRSARIHGGAQGLFSQGYASTYDAAASRHLHLAPTANA